MPRKKVIEKEKITEVSKSSNKDYIFAVGRRKEAVARVRLYNPPNGKIVINGTEYKRGAIIVNGKPIEEYFRFLTARSTYRKIFEDTDTENKFIFSIIVEGGGLSGQLGAVIHGMARSLDKQDREKYRKILKDKKYLTRDARVRERRKVGMGGKARRKKQSPKR